LLLNHSPEEIEEVLYRPAIIAQILYCATLPRSHGDKRHSSERTSTAKMHEEINVEDDCEVRSGLDEGHVAWWLAEEERWLGAGER